MFPVSYIMKTAYYRYLSDMVLENVSSDYIGKKHNFFTFHITCVTVQNQLRVYVIIYTHVCYVVQCATIRSLCTKRV